MSTKKLSNDTEDAALIKKDAKSLNDVAKQLSPSLTDKEQYLVQLPKSVRRRLLALKKLQLEATHIEADFFMEIHKMECRYHQLYSKLYEKRQQIVNGTYEPTDDDCEFPEGKYKSSLALDEFGNDVLGQLLPESANKMDNDVKGIPNFWLTIFKNVALLNDMVQPHDEPILKHLQDIKVVFLESNPMGFILEFHFSPNEYFSNSVLTKRYEMKCAPSPEDPFSFEGPEIYTCKGCVINWYKGKNVTMKVIKKQQKHRSKGIVRTVMKTLQNHSFFNFFTPPKFSDDSDADIEAEFDEEIKNLLTTDFEIGHYIRERIVPHAVLYITGEAFEDEEEYEEVEESEDAVTTDSEEAAPGAITKIAKENYKFPNTNNPNTQNECTQQ
ncbi:nucleosome assembly protein 1-like 4 [Cimex lectularius]|uniref:Nucleosome assembly protein 1-like 4 n=1 Tax=Cimex lectularius TaxID=79782 RepID=A0A8I6RWW9_CIMLE|nr:nucleosome assembly protein 1-like 4 [Cimex lectularius]